MKGRKNRYYKQNIKSFITGVIIGVAFVLGAYFTYLLITNDQEERRPAKYVFKVSDSIPALYNIAGFSRIFRDNSLMSVDSVFYINKWNQLIEMSGYREMDSMFLDSVIRKMYFDSIKFSSYTSADTIILQNDKFISSSNIIVKVQKLLSSSNDTSSADYTYSEAKFIIEYWESPLKFKGFKKNDNHVVVFGINPKFPVSFMQIDNMLYLSENQLWYSLPNSTTFSSFIPVTSSHILSRLKAAQKQL